MALLLSFSAVAKVSSPYEPIREQAYLLRQHFRDNCQSLLDDVPGSRALMMDRKFDKLVDDMIDAKWSRELLKSVYRSTTPDSRNPEINARFSLAAFVHLARTAKQQPTPMMSNLIQEAVSERSELLKVMVTTLVFRFGSRAEEFAKQANLVAVDPSDLSTKPARQEHLQRSSEILRVLSWLIDELEIKSPDFFFDLALKAHQFDSLPELRRMMREFKADTRLRTQREYLARKKQQLFEELQKLLASP
jgi:hypothetical protein